MRQHKLLYASSYDRGLQNLLFIWPEITKQYPDAELHCAYGWQTFDALTSGNPERKQWKKIMEMQMNQPGIIHHGRLSKEDLDKLTEECGIWAYPTSFEEINCITALNCQKLGCVPVVTNFAALKETVGSGIKVDVDINTPEGKDKYLEELLKMMGDELRWEDESNKGKEFAKSYNWSKIASKWDQVFKKEDKYPLVSIITPTIRTGWWNIMAENLSKQEYQRFEWLIIDDYKEDRSEIAKKYADKYELNIKYIRGAKALGGYKRPCALVRANNLGWKESKGELLVWLQDFILLDPMALQRLVSLHNHHPNSILAPVDEYYNTIEVDKTNKEDWWNGETKILTNKSWSNPRCKNEGLRESDNPYDYEANFGAIPRHVLDACNGWYEFLDSGLGYDNWDLAFRSLNLGFDILVDDTNICKCINIWPVVGGTGENVLNRERMANPPRALWLKRQVLNGKLPLKRDEELDESIDLLYSIPKEITDDLMSEWIDVNKEKIASNWKDL